MSSEKQGGPLPEMSATELKARLDAGDALALVDVREDFERRIADLPDVDPTVRGTMDYGLGLVHNLKAEFDDTLDRGGRRASGFVVPEPEVLGVALA